MSDSERPSFTVDHVLHGYSDGHRLLASTKKLSRDSQRLMLVSSDMSGPTMVAGFEEYLTGYPLKDDGLYAFAKTWYASEMPRPGCVWTHTLLLDVTGIDTLRDLPALVALFRRPEALTDASYYAERLSVPITETTSIDAGSYDVASPVLQALYGSHQPVLVVAKSSTEFQSLVLAVFRQQWTFNRFNFRFSTGSIRFRDQEGQPFDLQVLAEAAVRDTERRYPSSIILRGMPFPQADRPAQEWLHTALEDLAGGGVFLDRFLSGLGPDPTIARTDFPGLVQVFSAIQEAETGQRTLAIVVSTTAEAFPYPTQACSLKTALFGLPSARTHLLHKSEFEMLKALASSMPLEAFDPQTLALRERAAELWISDHERFTDEILPLFRAPFAPIPSAIAQGVVSRLAPQQVCGALARCGALASLIADRADLLAVPDTWRCPPEYQVPLADEIASRDRTSVDAAAGIIRAQLLAQADAVAEKMAAWLGPFAVHATLDYIASDPPQDAQVTHRWRQVLSEQPHAIIDWITTNSSVHPSTVVGVLELLDVRNRAVREVDATVWMALGNDLADRVGETLHVDLASFLLVVAATHRDPSRAPLFAQFFPEVYSAAERNRITDRSLNLLQVAFSGVTWHWDKCRRLRRGLVETFTEYGWPSDSFLAATRDASLLSTIYDMWGWGQSDQQFLAKVIRDASRGHAHATEEQLHVLQRFRKWFK